MTDYISKEAALDRIIGYDFQHCPDNMEDWATELKHAVICDLKDAVETLPAADVAPVVHAEWVLMTTRDDINGPESYSWNCNGCGYRRKSGNNITVRMRKPKGMYCEHCGAKMNGGEQDAVD